MSDATIDPHADAAHALKYATESLTILAGQANRRGGFLGPIYEALAGSTQAMLDTVTALDKAERLDTPKVLDETFGPNTNHSLRVVV